MERFSDTIPQGVTVDIRSSPTEDSSSLLSTNGKTDYMRIGLIITILLFLGVNVFSYLGDFLRHVKEFFAPLLKSILDRQLVGSKTCIKAGHPDIRKGSVVLLLLLLLLCHAQATP